MRDDTVVTGRATRPETAASGQTWEPPHGCHSSQAGGALPSRERGKIVSQTDKPTSDLGARNAVIYCADVGTWMDSDGDGLGITILWLMPF